MRDIDGPDFDPTEFIAGYPGPPAVDSPTGGSLRIIDLLFYRGGLTIHWLMSPPRDLNLDQPAIEQGEHDAGVALASQAQLEVEKSLRVFTGMWNAVSNSTVADELGTIYYHHGAFSRPLEDVLGSHYGGLDFAPGVPRVAKLLTWRVNDIAIEFPIPPM